MTYFRHFINLDLSTTTPLPTEMIFSFRKLFRWWEQQAQSDDDISASKARKVITEITKFPDLLGPLKDSDLEKYQPQIEMLLSPFFPEISSKFDFKAAGIPFKTMFFNPTKRFENLLDAAEGDVSIPMKDKSMMYVFACMVVLDGYYRAGINFMHDLHFDFHDKKAGVTRRFLSKINAEFVDILPNENTQNLTKEDIHDLLDHFEDVEYWKKKIPPGSFRFEGFTIVSLFDVTHAESRSALKYDLLNKDAFVDPVIVNRIEKNFAALLNLPNVHAGFMLYNKSRHLLRLIGSTVSGNSSLMGQAKRKPAAVFNKPAIHCIFENRKPYIQSVVTPDDKDFFTKGLLEKNIRSYIALPLFYDEELIGILELGAHQPNMLNAMTMFTLEEIILLLSTAMNRLQNEQQNEVEAIIRQKCTAIHPTVAWRFTEAAERLLESARSGMAGLAGSLEDIVFNDVYPLYGQADIQDSSLARNGAIQADMIEQLSLAKDILDLAASKFSLPVYKDLQFRTESYIRQLQQQLSAGDENRILEFFREQLEPVFSFFHTMGAVMHDVLTAYENRLDPELGVVYDKRKEYERCVKVVNDTIGHYLDRAQLAAQEMFPHYLEKYKTDGVEHNLYIGQSMVETRDFHPLYLQNLRLWQLLVCCEIENEVYNLPAQDKNGLRICSLILVHANPVNIRFRMDEKKFDVDGAYNIRYEILKKRIDKAYVKGTNERLTQPGKLAIVYSQDKEAREYLNYLQYLQSVDYISSNIERLELKDLQGITGLKALRAELIYNPNFEGIQQSKTLQMSFG
ncbi:GAF domain-containing protein [Flavitalea antarctica]